MSPLREDSQRLLTLNQGIETLYPDIVAVRRHIHANPELSGQEQGTAAFVFDRLTAAKLSPRMCAGNTGVAVTIQNGTGPTIVLRADMDALPLEENTGLEYKSRVPGVMHACGHDMHTAILVGTALLLSRLKQYFQGSVVCLFQPSEEVEPGGALGLISEKAFPASANAVFGLHVSSDHTVGQVGIKPGPECAGVLTFDAVVRGRGGHGAFPDKAIDPVVCVASIIMNLQTLVSRECRPGEPAVCTIGKVTAGTTRNIIADEARFSGTVRTFSRELQQTLKQRIQTIITRTAASFRATADVSFTPSYPAGYNDPALTTRVHSILAKSLGKNNVIQRTSPVMFAEDFAYYQQKTPGVYLHLGVRPKNRKQQPGIHSAMFSPDEQAIKTGMRVWAEVVMGEGRGG